LDFSYLNLQENSEKLKINRAEKKLGSNKRFLIQLLELKLINPNWFLEKSKNPFFLHYLNAAACSWCLLLL
jgi:hypothetical protein